MSCCASNRVARRQPVVQLTRSATVSFGIPMLPAGVAGCHLFNRLHVSIVFKLGRDNHPSTSTCKHGWCGMHRDHSAIAPLRYRALRLPRAEYCRQHPRRRASAPRQLGESSMRCRAMSFFALRGCVRANAQGNDVPYVLYRNGPAGLAWDVRTCLAQLGHSLLVDRSTVHMGL